MTEKIIEGDPYNPRLPGNKCLGQLVYDYLNKNGERTMTINADTDARTTFKGALDRSAALARTLQQKGVCHGDIVLCICGKNFDNVPVILASVFIGAKIANLDSTALTYIELEFIIYNVNPAAIFVEQEVFKKMEPRLLRLTKKPRIFYLGGGNLTGPPEFSGAQDDTVSISISGSQNFPRVLDLNEESIFIFTSGTLSLPKAIKYKQKDFIKLISEHMRVLGDVKSLLIDIGLHSITSIEFFFSLMFSGSTRMITSQGCSDGILKNIQKYKPDAVFLTPTCINYVCNESSRNSDTSSVTRVFTSGTRIFHPILKKLATIFKKASIEVFYELAETGFISVTTFKAGNLEQDFKIGGKLRADIRVQVMADVKHCCKTKFLSIPERKIGEICVDLKSSMPTYFRGRVFKMIFADGGFYRTGDMGYCDSKTLYVLDRAKEVFNFNKTLIFPSVGEDLFLRHPEIVDAMVLGVKLGPRKKPVACVTTKGPTRLTEEELILYVENNANDANYKPVGGVMFIDEFPKGTAGKILRGRMSFLMKIIFQEKFKCET